MERFFVLDKINTWYNWSLVLTGKDVTPPEPKTNCVDIDGMSGTLDLSESLTGETTYSDRKLSATFWTNSGSREERVKLLREIITTLHGKKIKIIEPDDPNHYFFGRVRISALKNIIPYAEFSIEATCEPWRYAVNETVRRVDVNSQMVTDVVITNNGVKSLCPSVTVSGSIDITYNGVKTSLTTGSYKISDIRLTQGVNIIGVSGDGSVSFTYREADL